jgi:hypothetical protein
MRLFGPMEIAFSLKSTTFQSSAGIRVSAPLGAPRNPAPRAVRVTWPGYQTQGAQVAVFTSFPALRRDAALTIETGNDIVDVVRGRDRLHAEVLRARLEAVRAGALREP